MDSSCLHTYHTKKSLKKILPAHKKGGGGYKVDILSQNSVNKKRNISSIKMFLLNLVQNDCPESEKQCSSGTVFSAFCTVALNSVYFLLNSVALTIEALKTELQ